MFAAIVDLLEEQDRASGLTTTTTPGKPARQSLTERLTSKLRSAQGR